ncbi:FXYD domain containing ion transport regulator 6 like isoform X4 [Astyanax mexicanus]|uniref:FXYD domain containing ion transport regulator 6 like isoform X4 n=1 Tax=Astyanax mexicanus TaxID=7994 RepID=UPI000BBD6C93|nr:FXYD domain containing ion transport regulator 6 like isoform X4 [Astyanax mexicanus]
MELSLAAVLCSSFLVPALASTMDELQDYESVRIGGLIFAAVLFFMGIFIVISRKCRCRGSQASKPVGPDPEAAKGRN